MSDYKPFDWALVCPEDFTPRVPVSVSSLVYAEDAAMRARFGQIRDGDTR